MPDLPSQIIKLVSSIVKKNDLNHTLIAFTARRVIDATFPFEIGGFVSYIVDNYGKQTRIIKRLAKEHDKTFGSEAEEKVREKFTLRAENSMEKKKYLTIELPYWFHVHHFECCKEKSSF